MPFKIHTNEVRQMTRHLLLRNFEYFFRSKTESDYFDGTI